MEAYCSSSCFFLASADFHIKNSTAPISQTMAPIVNVIGHIAVESATPNIFTPDVATPNAVANQPKNHINLTITNHPVVKPVINNTVFPVNVPKNSISLLSQSISHLKNGSTLSPMVSPIAPSESLKAFH
uniref:Uncharacterized protein n=1 Tax=virus sp. ctkyY8 TaxID=2827995 RepID=A0A8S5RDU6_9VIRU|nr:MAG TPA: hypothetical protein [virus sp. ctkyY8]